MGLMMSLPTSIVVLLNPGVSLYLEWRAGLGSKIRRAIDDLKGSSDPISLSEPLLQSDSKREATTFHSLVNTPLLPPVERKEIRLRDEGEMVVTAGGETTAQVISRIVYHILANKDTVLVKLRAELKQAIPDPTVMPSLRLLQNLKCLSTIVEEGLRISTPVLARSPRVFPHDDLVYKQHTVPRGNAVSTSPYIVLTNKDVFPEPFKFKPERWLTINPKTGEMKPNREMMKYNVAFGKGRRACLGKTLAYAELYFAIAVIFRRFELELYETGERDVRTVHDYFLGVVEEGSKGVRVRIVREILE